MSNGEETHKELADLREKVARFQGDLKHIDRTLERLSVAIEKLSNVEGKFDTYEIKLQYANENIQRCLTSISALDSDHELEKERINQLDTKVSNLSTWSHSRWWVLLLFMTTGATVGGYLLSTFISWIFEGL